MSDSERERAAIVKWLRGQKLWTALLGFKTPQMLAKDIEDGDHLQEQSK